MVHPDILAAVQRTGAELLRRFEQREVVVRPKGTELGSEFIVSDADTFSEQQLLQAIRASYPEDGVRAEEGSSHDGTSQSVWHVDPLDGTMNFSRGIPLWGLSLGRATAGMPDIGVIYLPALGLLFVAESGRGATCNSQSVNVSSRPLQQSMYCGGGFGGGKSYLQQGIALHVQATRVVESSAHELCLIARGDAEIYALRNVPHDVVAGAVIVQEAGGTVTDWQGVPYTTEAKDILVTNGVVHQEILELLKG